MNNFTKLRRFKLQISVLVLLLLHLHVEAQRRYALSVNSIDKDSAFTIEKLGLQTQFSTKNECISYVNQLSDLLHAKGYMTASVDSAGYDSSSARVYLYIGERYQWAELDTKSIDRSILEAIGWRDQLFAGKPMDFSQVTAWQDRILSYMENNGHPFAKVYMDSLQIDGESVRAQLKLNQGPLYHIDSIRVFGNAKISNEYLQRYLDIRDGSIFSKEKLLSINKKMRELTYVEEEYPSRLVWLGSGSILELYLKQKKSSQANVLIGFLPNSDASSSKKLLITGEANLNLKNALGSGETIGLNWQQLQVKSPRLNIIYQHPYLFNTPIGLDFAFNMFRKDSTFLNVNFQFGVQYRLSQAQSGKLFIQSFQTILNGVNLDRILQTHSLPDEADVSTTNLGIDYELNTTNYRLNPTKGNELRVITTAGIKKIKKNNAITELKDPGNPSFDFDKLYDTVKLKTYQFRVIASGAKYFPLGSQHRSAIKTAMNGGFLQSQNIFRNELFQIGGYRLLRGFDEESQYLSQYVIGTVEYHYLVGQDSYFYLLFDGGWGRNHSQNINVSYTYFGTGIGLAFQTKAGIFNLAWAVGRRNDVPFNLRQSKIHFGFASYF
jgi:outer membrane protein assembly factor BamA